MSLREYNQKRDFKKTREPIGKIKSSGKKLIYTIQKHDASRLHYDLRLELDGVLKSWAVPKGPSLDPKVKRLAMQVEDHPFDYRNFEGTIPEGEYGAGTVMLWDKGEWIPVSKNPSKSIKEGALRFKLQGEKLGGYWKLVRMKQVGESSWLLVKEADEFSSKKDVLEAKPLSVKSGKDLEEIAGGKKVTKKVKAKAAKSSVSSPAITNPDKIYYPEKNYRKIDLLQYYYIVADKMLPYIKGRPLMLVRCPDGAGKQCFYQKHWLGSFSKNVKKIKIKGDDELYFTVENKEGILELGQLGSLEIHTWNSHVDNLEKPDQWVFDLDPDPGVSWKQICQSALDLRDLLAKYKLKSFVKVSGGKGLHIVVPLQPEMNWDLSKKFTKAICEDLANSKPDLYVLNMSKAKRKNKIFLDYLRNTRGATAVAPYSPRAKANATVALPVSWEDVKKNIKADAYTIKNTPKALKKDPWKNFFKVKQLPRVP